ncbi:Aldo/keto reductase [Amanita muscaria]
MSSVFDIGYCVPIPQDEPDDLPISGRELIVLQGPLKLPSIVYGAASLCDDYNSNEFLSTFVPLRTVRLALRYGIRAFDTSVYYGKSEIVLGNILKALELEFPRSSYQLMTKCGRYGTSSFDYSQKNIRESVMNSLRRLQTDYLDTVYLHDVEFVCTPVSQSTSGNHIDALNTDAEQYGLADEDRGTIRGPGDQTILDAILELRRLQDEGIVKHIGITGYPLPTLLRLAILVLHHPPYKPLDVVLSYCHLTLQNSTFIEFASHFETRAGIGQLVAASPLSMGLLTPSVPKWHPAPAELREIVEESRLQCPMDLPDLALGFSIRHAGTSVHDNIPLVVGLSTPNEVHQCIKVWREMQGGSDLDEREKWEKWVIKKFEDAGFKDWSWA